ncbi:hypothetical protein HHK36_018075 [Tetracentron sinense]|uniref:Uncharacterized protein n=1 Tax=Tetracentron sinense TaxID=13715 RepID=A0A834Z386_TETSI|nr:hypothetical protein HHK36_018075 [Tetracentron sinense]
MAGRSEAMYTRVMYHLDQAFEEIATMENEILQKENGEDVTKELDGKNKQPEYVDVNLDSSTPEWPLEWDGYAPSI